MMEPPVAVDRTDHGIDTPSRRHKLCRQTLLPASISPTSPKLRSETQPENKSKNCWDRRTA